MPSDDEKQWIAQAQRGDDNSFAHLVDLYQKPVYNLCYRMLGNPYEAEDAAQETFLRAYKAIGSYDAERRFVTWLLSIASHYCIDQIRRRRFQFLSLDDHSAEMVGDASPAPDVVVGQNEDHLKVQMLLKKLNPTDRAIIILFYWYDHNYEEIASILSLSLSAVKSRLHRARVYLAKVWRDQEMQPLTMERANNESPIY